MSHETPTSNVIDANRPYLVPRNNANIEVWHVETNADGSPKLDDKNWVVVKGQHQEEVDGEMTIPSTVAHPDAFSDEVQSHYAEELASGRVYNKDVTDRGLSPQKLGSSVLESVEVSPPELDNDVKMSQADLIKFNKADEQYDRIMDSAKSLAGGTVDPYVLSRSIRQSVNQIRALELEGDEERLRMIEEALEGVDDRYSSGAVASKITSVINSYRGLK